MLPQPNGCRLTNDQWDAVIEILKARELIHFLILPIKDLVPVWKRMPTPSRHCQRWITRSGEQFVLENFSLYGERVGGLSVLCEDAEAEAAYWGN